MDNVTTESFAGQKVNIKFIKNLPFWSFLDNSPMDCCLWKADKNICEYSSQYMADPSDTEGACDTSGLFYGTSDSREPKFCARHFYQLIVSGDGKTNYSLISDEQAKEFV